MQYGLHCRFQIFYFFTVRVVLCESKNLAETSFFAERSEGEREIANSEKWKRKEEKESVKRRNSEFLTSLQLPDLGVLVQHAERRVGP